MRIEYKDPKESETTENKRPVYESDLTKEQKRQLEREKIKHLSGTKKLGYLWTYYKIWLLIPLLLIVAIITGIQIWQNAQEKPLLYVNISDPLVGTDDALDSLSTDLIQQIGTGNTHETVPVTTSILSTSDYEASVMMSVWLSTKEMDIVICDEETYRQYVDQGVFLTNEELFGDDLQKVESQIKDGALQLNENVWSSYGITDYTPVCAGVLTTSEHKEAAKTALLYLLSVE